MAENEKGAFHADIDAGAVAEALASVEKRGSAEEEVAVEPAGVEGGEVEELKRELEQKDLLIEESMRRGRESMERLREVNERMLRYAADLENYKKRAQKEMEETRKFGSEKLLKDLLPVLDNLDRALSEGVASADLASFSKGVQMTRRLFEDTLARYEVKAFSAVGATFDPQLHEALQQVESKDVPPGTVVSEMVRGYTLHGRLVRPALVVVARAASGETRDSAAAEDGAGEGSSS